MTEPITRPGASTNALWKWLGLHLKGHALLFGDKSPPTYTSSAGLRLLLVFIVLEGVIGPRLWLFSLLGLPLPPAWLRIPVLLALALVLIWFFARLRPAHIGLYAWRDWNVTERSYLLQTFLIGNAVFGIVFASRLRMILADTGLWGRAAIVVFTQSPRSGAFSPPNHRLNCGLVG